MTNWQITAQTILCDAVDDEVTVLLYKNGTVRCTGCNKYEKPNGLTRKIVKEKSHRLKRPLKCEGEQCSRVTTYRQKILAEEPNRES